MPPIALPVPATVPSMMEESLIVVPVTLPTKAPTRFAPATLALDRITFWIMVVAAAPKRPE